MTRSFVFVGLLLGAAAVLAADERSSPQAEAAPAQRAYIDPATGRLESPPEGYVAPEDETQAKAKDVQPMELTRSATGRKMLKTNGRVRTSVVATVGADGTLHADCVDGEHVGHAAPESAPEH